METKERLAAIILGTVGGSLLACFIALCTVEPQILGITALVVAFFATSFGVFWAAETLTAYSDDKKRGRRNRGNGS